MRGLVSGTLPVAAEQATARGVRGVVLAAAPLAAALGAEAMRAGGNAYDGVITAALAETVLLPPKCGLAGDLVALRVRPRMEQPEALLAIGGGPRRLAEAVAEHGLEPTGPRSVGVPGAPAGYATLATSARLPLERLAAPAVTLARKGFVWAAVCTALAVESLDLVRAHNPDGTRYYPGWTPIQPGEVMRLPGLADLLEEFVERGAGLFLGPAGEAVAQSVRDRGGVLEPADFAFAAAQWVPAASGWAGGRRLWATPAPTHGPSLLDAMAAGTAGDGPAQVWDRVAGAVRRRAPILADSEGTSMVSAADAEGNVVVVIHSNSFPRFGSGLILSRYDLILNNRPGRGFSAIPGHPNHPAPGKRPATTLHAWSVSEDDGNPFMLGGTPGGDNQMPWNAQALTQVLAGEVSPGILVVSPRWEWEPGDGLVVEEGFPPHEERLLTARATRVERVPRWGLRCAQQAILRPRPGRAIVGAVDPRTGGAAVAV